MSKRRVVICTHASIYASLFVTRILEHSGIEVVGIVNSSRVLKKKESWLGSVLNLIQKTGVRYALMLFAITSVFDIVSLFTRLKSIGHISDKHGIEVFTTSDINRPECINWLRDKKPDLMISVFFNQIIGEEAVDIPEIASINVHPSLLPDYRGVDPVFYMLTDRKKEVGYSVHYIAQDIDGGNIIDQEVVTLDNAELFDTYSQLFSRAADTVATIIQRLEASDVGDPQMQSGRYDSWPTSKMIKEFKKQGNRLISLSSYLKIINRR